MGLHKKLKDLKIGYLMGDEGLKEGRPSLVMVHGAGGRAQIWQNQVVLLDKSINTLAVDLPGHGDTAGNGRSHIFEYAQWLADIVKKIFEYPIFLMGHSMGGAIVQEVAVSSPHCLGGIILVGTGARLKVAPMFLDGLLNNFEQTLEAVMGFAYAPETAGSLIEQGKEIMISTGSNVVYNDFLACDRFDGRQALAKIHHPCLVLCGDKDKLAPLKFSEALSEGIKRSTLKIIPNAGHMVMIERYVETNEVIQDFIFKAIS
jgi:pimeloyl-ACP methyl ester carboxylesterase